MYEYLKVFWSRLPEWAKAIVGGLGAAVVYLIGKDVIDLSLNPLTILGDTWGNLKTFTTEEWLTLIGVTLGLGASVWWIPNREPVTQ